MNFSKNSLSKQLLLVVGFAFVLLFISLGAILPRLLIPVAEENIYNYLREPLRFYNENQDNNLSKSEIAYIYLKGDSFQTSPNIQDVIKYDNMDELLKKMNKTYGKFFYNRKIYYYYTLKNDSITKIALSNNNYINETKQSILKAIFPLVLFTFLLTGLMIVFGLRL